jgi:hypothetical protein
MEHILSLGTGEGVFHLHEINVEDNSPVLFASVPISISSDPTRKDIDLARQAHIQHQCSLIKRQLKSLYLLYSNPCFDEIHLSVSDIYSFKFFLRRIASGEYPDIRLTKEGIKILGAINSKINTQINNEDNFNGGNRSHEGTYSRSKSRHPFILDRNASDMSTASKTSPRVYSQPLSLVPKPTLLQEQ